jgi:hypothetical protein
MPYLVRQAAWLRMRLGIDAPAFDSDGDGKKETVSGAWKEELAARIARIADDLERGKAAPPEVVEFLRDEMQDIGPPWSSLEEIARRLEVLAHKGLRGVAWSEDERRFLQEEYGPALGRIELYGGNLYLTPRDDAPRAADVFWNPNEGKHLVAAIGRPRAMYVLHPWKGKVVLCIGAVLPYHEFTSGSRLTDGEWKAILDGKERPAPPSWVEPILSATDTTSGRE